ncbi:MAG: lysA 2, partial [Deltaproteobacteria bacterium]|nr:lysA 2 [Deltaproteobacteria bacterium]
AIVEVLREFHPADPPAVLPTIILEPGKAITSTSQMLLLRVLDVKPARDGIRDVIVDGGRSAAGPLGWECHELLHAARPSAPPEGYYRIFGPTCTPFDILYHVKRLPALKKGDVLALMDAGAYFVPMQTNFSFPRAAAVMVDDGKHWPIRRRETYDDIVGKDILPDDVYVMMKPSR